MTDQVYFWQDESGAWQLCRKTGEREWFFSSSGEEVLWREQVQHLYSNRLEWVPESKLQPYYGDNQPEGAKK